MKFRMLIKNVGECDESAWWETEDVPTIDTLEEALIYSKKCVSHFNRTLQPGELPRAVVRIEVIGKSDKHLWSKTNTTTLSEGHSLYDAYVCDRCGITGRRYGLSPSVSLDKRYKLPGFQSCAWTLEHKKSQKPKRNTKERENNDVSR